MFIVILTYTKPISEVDRHLEAHIEFLEKFYATGNFIASGRQNPRVGGVILCKAATREEVETIIAQDPFNTNSVADYRIIEFQPTKYVDGFSCAL